MKQTQSPSRAGETNTDTILDYDTILYYCINDIESLFTKRIIL